MVMLPPPPDLVVRTSLDLLLMLNPGTVLETWTFEDRRAVVDLIRVPEERRRRRVGSMIYLTWERTLPWGTTVELHVVDGVAAAFWKSLGFLPLTGDRMVKTLSHPEPRPIPAYPRGG